jgi:surface polysaccharide O-acyltransferase-like enzyme
MFTPEQIEHLSNPIKVALLLVLVMVVIFYFTVYEMIDKKANYKKRLNKYFIYSFIAIIGALYLHNMAYDMIARKKTGSAQGERIIGETVNYSGELPKPSFNIVEPELDL